MCVIRCLPFHHSVYCIVSENGHEGEIWHEDGESILHVSFFGFHRGADKAHEGMSVHMIDGFGPDSLILALKFSVATKRVALSKCSKSWSCSSLELLILMFLLCGREDIAVVQEQPENSHGGTESGNYQRIDGSAPALLVCNIGCSSVKRMRRCTRALKLVSCLAQTGSAR